MHRYRFILAALIAVLPCAPVAGQQVPAGAALFKQRCALCHSSQPGRNGAGPSLAGVKDRKAGSVAGFGYSSALRGSGLTWTNPQLDEFLASPQKVVPGTRMPLAVSDAQQRAAIIAYLSTLR